MAKSAEEMARLLGRKGGLKAAANRRRLQREQEAEIQRLKDALAACEKKGAA